MSGIPRQTTVSMTLRCDVLRTESVDDLEIFQTSLLIQRSEHEIPMGSMVIKNVAISQYTGAQLTIFRRQRIMLRK